MPELPEVETVRRGLQAQLSGACISSVRVFRHDSIGYPSSAEFVRRLTGRHICRLGRRGKYLLVDLSDETGMAVHLRMSGRLLVLDSKDADPRHLRVSFSLADGRRLVFDDPRVFGRLWCVPPGKTFEDIVPALKLLGPEAIDEINPDYLLQAFTGKSQPVKSALLDQTLIAGIGNIYADESLFRSGINPQRSAGKLRRPELKRLAREIREVLCNAIELGGSTLRDYTDSRGVNGKYQHEALVYGREDEPCRSCRTAIQKVKIAGRSSHFCPRCQR